VVFDTSFQAAYGITSISVLEPQPVVKSSSSALSVGLGVGIGVGGNCLLLAAIAVFVHRRRKMNLQANNPATDHMSEQQQNVV
jgi:hypothetical protein